MTDQNFNPYYDHDTRTTLPAVQGSPSDSGMPGWMPVSALFVGLALFGVVLFGAAHSGNEVEPTQGGQQAATQPAKTNADQPAATQAKSSQASAAQQGQQSQVQQSTGAADKQQQKANAQPPNPTATTGAAPAQ